MAQRDHQSTSHRKSDGNGSASKSKMTPEEQSKRFIEMAEELGADDDAAFERVMNGVAQAAKKPK